MPASTAAHKITRHEDGGWYCARCSCGKSSPLTVKGQATAWANRHLNSVPAEVQQLTDTELETLAVLLNSASEHMTYVRNSDGRYVWGNPDRTAGDNLTSAIEEMISGFYEIQLACRPNSPLVTIHG